MGNPLTDLSFTFRVDSIVRAAASPGVGFVGISFEVDFLAKLSDVVEAARSLAHQGLAVQYIPVRAGVRCTDAGFSVEFVDGEGEVAEVEFEELRVRPTGGIEVHGFANGISSHWVRADTSIDEMELVVHAAAGRSRRQSHFTQLRRAA
jgi:hypothetical protein